MAARVKRWFDTVYDFEDISPDLKLSGFITRLENDKR